MPEIEFAYPDGSTELVTANIGQNVMKVAVNNNVRGIVGECGGEMSCATCHVVVMQGHQSRFEEASEDELDVLSSLDTLEPHSRLGCQLRVPAEDTIRFTVPDA
ncbi:2Fe-2S iron-sulfur cluster-binding protein [Paenarthrobacter aromaticivorans]|uniref:2Fe-2S iron-sulfur cluster binding domain-containing protein n=1 Tax=Paenarthrobacter aromaticivorans TaxID=2849150 RepID=A0ABS6ICA4_9MICC|nr:2Fe-2S iron-sulfur cluster-binding protein [Paenarthrobacter sp. MMS21-TAE1-1]MBU8868493.1 2Fe-2S iron-sulfur cluster binding domain-containing protein [Paenarthrobacter sp. MMS21-TAE1-1]